MKVLGWILFLTLSTAHAQPVIESAPLSVEDDGVRKISVGEKKQAPVTETKEIVKVEPVEVKSEALEDLDKVSKKDAKKLKASEKKEKVAPIEPAPAIVVTPVVIEEAPVNKKTNPIDGQLKLESAGVQSVVVPVKKPDEIIIKDSDVAIKTPDEQKNVDTIAVAYYDSTLLKYLQFSFGYIGSRYDKVNSTLDNGSASTSFKFVADVTPLIQSGFAVEMLSDTSEQSVPNNIRVIQYRLFVDYHAPLMRGATLKMDWVGGLSLSIGNYNIKRRFLNASGQDVSVNIKEGTIIGLIPAAGLRFYLVGHNSFDLMVEYHQYFGNPQKYIGGVAFSPRINFVF